LLAASERRSYNGYFNSSARWLGILLAWIDLPKRLYICLLCDRWRYLRLACPVQSISFRDSRWLLSDVRTSVVQQQTAHRTDIGSGFKCLNNGIAQTCVLYASSTSFPIVTCQSGTSAAFSYYTLPTTVSATVTSASKVSVTAATITAFNMYAPMIQINWQSSDLPTTSTSTSGTSSASSRTSQTSIAQASSKLSTGAEAGIGVGVALGVIAIGIISWVLYRRRRKQEYVAAAGHSPTAEIGGSGIYEMGKRGRNDPIELPDNTSHNGGRGTLSELGT
jgi:LPXTG-motif cell wall-anchored protein